MSAFPCPSCGAPMVDGASAHFERCPIFRARKPRRLAGVKPRPRGLHKREILFFLVAERGDDCGICGHTLGDLALCNIDHIIPLGRSGTNAWSNLQPAHITCNTEKRDMLPEEMGTSQRISAKNEGR